MTQESPVVRASYAKTVIASMKQQAPVDRDALLARVGTELRRAIREHGLFDWMAAEQFATLAAIVIETLGPARAKLFWRTNLLGSLERKLLSPLRLGAVALYGNSPGSLLRMTPQAWHLVTRDCGTCRTSVEPDGMLLHFEALPPALCAAGMLLLWSGGCESCIERMGFGGNAEAALDPQRRGAVNVHVQWWARRGSVSADPSSR
jgi:hypothetical protein